VPFFLNGDNFHAGINSNWGKVHSPNLHLGSGNGRGVPASLQLLADYGQQVVFIYYLYA
jgi:hypothetical protein